MAVNLSVAAGGIRGANEIYRRNYDAIAETLNLNPRGGENLATNANAEPIENSAAVQVDELEHRQSVDLNSGKKIDFQIAENSAVLRVRDAQTGEMILQIPSEEILAAQQRLAKTRAQIFSETP